VDPARRPTRDAAIPAEGWLPGVARRRLRLASGVEIALLDWGGDGPLALLHHANGFCAGTWGLVAEGLRAHHRVVALDARGHGDSSRPSGPEAYHWDRFAEDLVEVAERLGEQEPGGRVALGVGHSFGGTALLGAAARRADLLGRLVLVDPVTPPPPRAVDPGRRERVGRLAEGARRRRGVFASREAARAHFARRSLFSRFDPRALDLYVVHALRERPDGGVELKCPGEIEARIFASASIDVRVLARRVRTPTLFLWARGGNFARAVYEEIAASMPEARVEDLDAGHLAPMERPQLVVAAVERFAGLARAHSG
jgi:pimeloyl-ACP methyl ester carboxylesterase